MQKKNFYPIFFLLILFGYFINSQSLEANEKQIKFAIVNMQKITESSDAFQDIKKQMESKANSMRTKFDNKNKEFRKKETEFEKKSKLLKADALQSEIDSLKKEGQKISDELNQDRQNLEKTYFETMNEFHKKVNKIITDYATEKKIDAVLEASGMVYFGKNLDEITDDLIKKINKEIKNFNIKFE
jgi:Skp family chaperone for outer membrane proteins